jgi:hypothetical protein
MASRMTGSWRQERSKAARAARRTRLWRSVPLLAVLQRGEGVGQAVLAGAQGEAHLPGGGSGRYVVDLVQPINRFVHFLRGSYQRG